MIDEKHKKYFRGVWAPPQLFEYLQSGVISCPEVCLLLFIDVFVNWKGDDCYASNSYLAECLGCTERYVQRMINHLVDIDLLRRRIVDGHNRYLRATWSRVPGGVRPVGRGGRPTGRGGDDLQVVPCIGLHTYDNYRGVDTPQPPRCEIKIKKKTDPKFLEYANRLHKAVSSVRQLLRTSKPGAWVKNFQQLSRMGASHERINAVLTWYEKVLQSNGDLITNGNPLFIPIAYSGPVWVKKWDALEQAMGRERSGGGKRSQDAHLYANPKSLVPKNVKNPY